MIAKSDINTESQFEGTQSGLSSSIYFIWKSVKMQRMKSVLIHDWLTSPIGGGENVLKEIHKLLPSPIYTLLSNSKKLQDSYFQDLKIHTSFIQKLPLAFKYYRNYLPLFPRAIESLDLKAFNLILSSSHCVAKGVKKNPGQLHICYCHTPVRYAWDLMDTYLKDTRGPKKILAKTILKYIRNWDARVSNRVDHFIANSNFVAERIKKFYRREAEVIYPPVNTHLFEVNEKKEDYYITTSRLVQNKRVDLLVDAFAKMPEKTLLIIGEGPEEECLKKRASKNIKFLGVQTEEALKKYLSNAKAFVFAAIEDFGIAPVEAMASGTPVIALGMGGALETVTSATGLFFPAQNHNALIEAVKKFEGLKFDPKECRLRAEEFSVDVFRRKFQSFVLDKCIEFNLSL